ncbi:MAG: hypothetical protein IKW92_07385 [Firmicutes bacterium]|nr:hypothetical protein [Bacillota bacterium]
MNRRGKRTAGIILAIIFLIAAAALYGYIYVVPSVTDTLTPTAIAQYGEMKTANPAKCVVFRSEKVVAAEQSGNAGYYVSEGAKTRLGVKVADIYPADGSGVGYFMETTGIVSYWYDGFEETFDPDFPETITLDSFPSDEEGAEQPPEPESVRITEKQEGDPLYKIITGDTWYMALRIESQYMDRYSIGSRIEVVFDETPVDATISRLTQYEDYWVVIAYSNRYYKDSAKLRYCDVTIVTEDNSGLLIPTTARAMQEQEDGSLLEGVYVKTIRGDYVFRRIQVLAEDEESGETLVTSDTFYEKDENGESVQVSTIGVYDEVLRDAGGLSDVTISTDEEPEEEEIVFEWEKVKEEPEPEPVTPEEPEEMQEPAEGE